MTKYDDYKKAIEKANFTKPKIRSENGMFCYPDEYGSVAIGKNSKFGSNGFVLLDIDEAIMVANFILDTFTDKGCKDGCKKPEMIDPNDPY